MKVLVAEDDQLTRNGLVEVLRQEGYDVVPAETGAVAIDHFKESQPDFVCLDIMMPQQNGYEVCRTLRQLNPDVPIIFISAKTEEVDKLAGFDVGADDFIEKPFSVREVIARIRAVTRRCYQRDQGRTPQSFVLADLEVFPHELRARRGETIVELSLRDVQILTLLHERPRQALDRNTIFNYAWGHNYFPSSRTLDQHISQLRKRIEHDPKSPTIIKTVHGVGYRYDPED